MYEKRLLWHYFYFGSTDGYREKQSHLTSLRPCLQQKQTNFHSGTSRTALATATALVITSDLSKAGPFSHMKETKEQYY